MNNSTPNYPPFIQRMIEEQQQLKERINKLELYIDSPKSSSLTFSEVFMLGQQHSAMQTYSTILDNRINYAKARFCKD